MRLSELEPKFMKRDDLRHFHHVETLAEADGIRFLCPKCWEANGGAKGTHGVICWNPGVSQDTRPTPGRWEMHGTGVDDLTLVAGSSSVWLKGGCGAHFHIRNGNIEMC